MNTPKNRTARNIHTLFTPENKYFYQTMRYHHTSDTLFVRGRFRAACTGISGGISDVSTLLNHTVPQDFPYDNPQECVEAILSKKGYGKDAFGLLTAVSMQHLCILQYDYITVFVTAGLVTAGVSDPNPDRGAAHTINIIVTSSEGFSDAALLETIITAAEAKAHALKNLGQECTGTTSDAVAAASEGEIVHTCAGTSTEPGKRIYAAVLKGVTESLLRQEGKVQRPYPSFFIYSRHNDTGWFEWRRDACPYYPCHFTGQACDFCYCPFYPCGDETLGEWLPSTSSLTGKVWACSECRLLHDREHADYLIKHPDAGLDEIKGL